MQRRVIALAHDTSSHCALQLYEVSSNSLNSFQRTGWTQKCIYLCSKGNNLKIYKQELWLLCMTRRVNVLYKCMKFYHNIFKGYQLTEQTRNRIANDQRVKTPKI